MRKLTQRSEGGGRISSKQGNREKWQNNPIHLYMDEDEIDFEELKVWLVNNEAKAAME